MNLEITSVTETTPEQDHVQAPAQTDRPDFIPTLHDIDIRNIHRILQPLDGGEVVKAILAHLERKLAMDNTFPSHIVYEGIVWKFTLVAEWQGFANNKTRVETSGKITVDEPTGTEKGSLRVDGAQLNKDIAPDEVRAKTGQGIPVIGPGKSHGQGGVGARVPASKLGPGQGQGPRR